MSDINELLQKIELVNTRAKSLLEIFQTSKLKDTGYSFSLARNDPTYFNMLCKDNTVIVNLPRINNLIMTRYLYIVVLNTESLLGYSVQIYSEKLIYDVKTTVGQDTYTFVNPSSDTSYKSVICDTNTDVMVEFSKISGISL